MYTYVENKINFMNRTFFHRVTISLGLLACVACEPANLTPPPVVLLTSAVAENEATGAQRTLDASLTEFVIDSTEVLTLGWYMKAEDELSQIDCSYNGDAVVIETDSTYKQQSKWVPIRKKREKFQNRKEDICDTKVRKLQGRLAITLQASDRQNRKTALTKQVVLRGR
jgi:hypothetical protein